MNSIMRYKTVAFLALIFWLLSNWVGAHGHFCFDGQEAPVSVHMDVMGGHDVEHSADEQHQDADIDLTQSALTKLGQVDFGLLLLACFVFVLLIILSCVSGCTYRTFYPQLPPHWCPPLRAPPLTA